MAAALVAVPGIAMAHGPVEFYYFLAWELCLPVLAIIYLITGSAPLRRRIGAVSAGIAAQVVAFLVTAGLDPKNFAFWVSLIIIGIVPLVAFALVLRFKGGGQGAKNAI